MEEFFDVVDDDDNAMGRASRKECHKRGLIHRSVMFFVFDKDSRVLVNRRTKDKDFFPGYWSVALGGHVHSGERYDDAIGREIDEETGITAKPFRMASYKKRIPEEKENVVVYGVIADRKPNLDSAEIAEGTFMKMGELENLVKGKKFLPETAKMLGILKEWRSGAIIHRKK